MDAPPARPIRSRAASALAALWLLLALGFALPSAGAVPVARASADAGPVAADRAQPAIVVAGIDLVAEDGDRIDDGPDGGPVRTFVWTGGGFGDRSAAVPAPRLSRPGRRRPSPFEARAPPLG